MADTTAQAGRPIELVVSGITPGLVGEIAIEAYDPTDGAVVLASRTTGITEPRAGTYRTALTFANPGEAIVRWTEPGGTFAEERVLVLAVAPTPSGSYLPTTADVAALLRARTKDINGAELGVFDSTTRPTVGEVEAAIDMAAAEVTGRVGTQIADRWLDAMRALIAIRAAMWVELSYFPEQIRSDRSVYQELSTQFEQGIASLQAALSDNVPAGAGSQRFGSLPVMGATAAGAYGWPENPIEVP